MKKVLIGCGILFLLGGMLVVGSGLWLANTVKNVAGDLLTATQTSMQMSLDRMEQDAATVSAQELVTTIQEHRNLPVRVKGKLMSFKDAQGQKQQGTDETAVLFMEPSVMIIATSPDVIPVKRPDGAAVEVLGIAGMLNLGAFPGLSEQQRADIQKQLGTVEMPVVVARKVNVTAP